RPAGGRSRHLRDDPAHQGHERPPDASGGARLLALSRRLLAITLAIMSGGTAWAGPAPAGPLGGGKSWAVCYGSAPETAAELARFALVVLDPPPPPPLNTL